SHCVRPGQAVTKRCARLLRALVCLDVELMSPELLLELFHGAAIESLPAACRDADVSPGALVANRAPDNRLDALHGCPLAAGAARRISDAVECRARPAPG